MRAAPGEVNRLAIARSDGIVVRDPGGGLGAGRACTGGGEEVACPEPVTRVTAELGDGPDTLEVAPPLLNVYVDAGEGDDVVTGASSSGGAGADQLVGGEGADVLDGGAGFDEVSYERFEVRVRLAGGALAGRGSVRVRRGRGAVVRVRLDGAAREALRRAGPLRVRIAVLERGVRTAAWTTAV